MKYYIIPKDDDVMTVEASDTLDALNEFAVKMTFDMGVYFRAVTEEEYEEYQRKMDFLASERQYINWAIDVLMSDFSMEDEDAAREIAEDAWDRYCEGNGQIEYECIEEAYCEYAGIE